MSNPEHNLSPGTESKSFDFEGKERTAFAFLNPDAIQLLRTRQDEMVRSAQAKVNHLDLDGLQQAEHNTYKDFDALIDKYLDDFGVAKDDPKRASYVATLQNYSINNMDDSEWAVGVYEEDGTIAPDGTYEVRLVSGRDKATKAYAHLLKNSSKDSEEKNEKPEDSLKAGELKLLEPAKSTPDEIKSAVDNDPAVKAARATVDQYRKRLAELSAQRQGKLYDRSKFLKEYQDTEDNYKRAVANLTKIEMDTEKTAGRTLEAEEERFEAAFRVINHFRALQEEAVENLRNTKVSKAIKWLTEGGTLKRMSRGALVGVSVGGIATAITLFTGGAALVGGVLAGGLVKAGAFTRAYAAFDNRKGSGRGMQVIANDPRGSFTMDTLNKAGVGKGSRDETIGLVQKHLMGQFEQETKKEQKERRKSTAVAMGAIVLGSSAAEGARWLVGSLGSSPGSRVFSSSDNTRIPTVPNEMRVPGNSPEVSKPGSGITHPESPTQKNYSLEARQIHKGEGFNSQFAQMGYSKEQWGSLLEEVGPKLHRLEVNGRPLAYKMPNGQWGMRMSPDGMMPKEALDIISSTHDQMFGGASGVSNVGPVEAPSSGSSVEAGSEMSAKVPSVNEPLSPAAGNIHEIIKGHAILPSAVESNPLLDRLTHVPVNKEIDILNQSFNLSGSEWQSVKDYIASQYANPPFSPIYRPVTGDVFRIDTTGQIFFNTDTIPDNTMADILNQVRTKLK